MRLVELVVVGYQPVWGKWPDTQDRDYSGVLAERSDAYYAVNGEMITVCMRWYPVHRAYVTAGVERLPAPHPFINNLTSPPQSVLDVMSQDLRDVAKDGCEICLWEHAYQCYPSVARCLKEIFAHSILVNADDCPGSTEIKTEPIAGFFDTVVHGNIIWTPDGKLTRDLYRRLGVADTHYVAPHVTGGFLEGIKQSAFFGPDGFDLDRRIRQLREKQYSTDLAFVGGCSGEMRAQLGHGSVTLPFQLARLRTEIYGVGMRDGVLWPRVPSTIGYPVAEVYLDSFAVLNLQAAGLMGSRPLDAWASGSLLVQWDPVGELTEIGVLPSVHYAPYDGTLDDLCHQVKYYQEHFDEAEAIIRAGHAIGQELPRKYSMTKVMERVLTANAHKWWK